MQISSKRSRYLSLCALAMALGFAFPAHADNQATAQQKVGKTNNTGSNDSLHESYGNALTAVSNFYQMDVPGAVKYGLKAYGQYRNSNQMDDLSGKGEQLAASMASVGSAPAAGALPASSASARGRDASSVTGAPSGPYVSPYARLDKNFLYQGSTAEIAGQMEKMTGMPRDQMFQMMVNVHTNSKFPSDPNFIPWAMQTYRDLSAKIPNAAFRDKLGALGGYLDKAEKSGLAQNVLGKFTAVDSGSKPASAVPVPVSEVTASNKIAPAVKEDTVPPPSGNVLANSPPPAPRETASVIPPKVGLQHLGLVPVDDYLGDILRGQVPDRSLFETVSAKLKELCGRHAVESLGAKRMGD